MLARFGNGFLEAPSQFVQRMDPDFLDVVDYFVQQVERFRKTLTPLEALFMSEQMNRTVEEVEKAILERMSVDKRLRGLNAEERVRGLNAEERVRGLNAEERVRGLNAEELLRVLGADEIERMRQLLNTRQSDRSTPGDRQ